MIYPRIVRNRYRVGETDNRQHASAHHEEDMRDFHLPLAALHQRHLHTWGICAGLEVSGAPGTDTVTVQPGTAIDAEGRMIVLADEGPAQTQEGNLINVPVLLRLSEIAVGSYYVTLTYGENEQPEPGDTTGRTRPINVRQVPLVRLQAIADFVENGLSLILAAVNVDDNHQLSQLSEQGAGGGRRIVGQALMALAFQRPVTEANQVRTALAGQLSALPQGGLQLTVANPADPIELSGAGDTHFAELRIRANATQIQGALTVQSALHVGGDFQVGGTTQMQGALTLQNALQVGGSLQVTGVTRLQDVLVGNAITVGDLLTEANPPQAKLTSATSGPGDWIFLQQQRAEASGGFHIHNPWRDTDGPARNRLEIAYRTASGEDLWEQFVLHGPTGNIGIGKGEPTHKVDVNGSLNASELYVNGAPLSTLLPAPSQWTTLANGIAFTNGNVGIRTATPEAPLHLHQSDLLPDSGLRITGDGKSTVVTLHVARRDYGYLHLGGDTHLRGGSRASSFEGNVGIGTTSPAGKLDVQGDIRAGNSDLYFTNANHRHTGIGNTVGWAAIENATNYDALMILGRAGTARGRYVRLWDYLQVNGSLDITGNVGVGTATPAVKLHVVGNRIRVTNPGNSNHYIDLRADGSALDLESSADLYLNNNGKQVYYRKLNPVSSRELKEEIRTLTAQEATQFLDALTPVQFRYKDDPTQEKLLGFIAEDVPAIIATPDRKGIVPMNIIAVLCGALRDQQSKVMALQTEMQRLQQLLPALL